MNTKTLAAVGAVLTLSAVYLQAVPLGTAFTYQGQLTDGGVPANGSYDLKFALFDAVTNGTQIGSALTNSPVGVTNGLFTTTLDFAAGVFTGDARWLELGVRTNGGAFANLAPRQELTPRPYALYAPSAGTASASSNLLATLSGNLLSGTYSNALHLTNAGNTFSGNGAGLTGLNANNLANGTVPDARLSANVALLNSSPTFSGTVTADGDLVGARLKVGVNHTLPANAPYATIAGGQGNSFQPPGTNTADNAVISGGQNNSIQCRWATIAGGMGNSIAAGAEHSSIGGGALNSILFEADQAVIGGGGYNTIGIDNNGATISGGSGNSIQQDAFFTTIGGGISNAIQSYADYGFIGGGTNNTIQSSSTNAVIAGGRQNAAGGFCAMVPGGLLNAASGSYSFAAGRRAKANHQGAFVWADSTDADFASSGVNQFLIRAARVGINTNNPSTTLEVLGTITADGDLIGTRLIAGTGEVLTGSYSSIAGGWLNTNQAWYSTIGGGNGNLLATDAMNSVIAGGQSNVMSGVAQYSVIAGGMNNSITRASTATIGAGDGCTISSGSDGATIAGGALNSILTNATDSTIGGGFHNTISANAKCATVPGGRLNTAGGTNSFAAGYRAKATNDGSFVWADSQDVDFASTLANQFLIRANGGVAINTNNPGGYALFVNGTAAKPGGGSWTTPSDARLKTNICQLTGTLERVLALRGVSFSYREPEKIGELPGPRLGMVAQEVERVFPDWVSEGPDGFKHLTYRGFEALAVEALRDLRAEKDRQLAEKEARIAELEKGMAELKALVDSLSQKVNGGGQ